MSDTEERKLEEDRKDKVLRDRLSEDEVRAIAYSSIKENEDRGLEAQQVIKDTIGHELTKVEGDVHDFRALAKELKCSVSEINAKIAKANAVFAECNRVNILKARSQGWEQAANSGMVGTEEAWEADSQGLAPRRGLIAMLEQDHGMQKLDDFIAHRTFKSDTGNYGQIVAAANAMTRDGGTGNDPTGITPNRPQQVMEPYQVVDRRRGISTILPRFPVTNDTFKYLKETETQSSANGFPNYQTAENASAPYQTIGAIEETTTVKKLAVFTSISREQLKDVPYARQYASMIISRQSVDATEYQSLQGDGNGNNLTGFFAASGTQTSARGNAETRKFLDFFADSFKAYGKPRASSGGGAGTSPSHLVLANDTYWDLCKQVGTDGHYLWGSPVSGGMSELWGVQILINDFLPADSALLFNNDPRYVLMVTREGYEFESGLNGEDMRYGRVSYMMTHRCALAYPRPVTIMKLTNLDATA